MTHATRVSVGDAATRLLEQDGPNPERPVLFVHGNPGSADEWQPFFEALEGKRRCLAPDVLGWGQSERVEGFRHTIDNLATFLEQLLDAQEVENFDLVAHDWGMLGVIAAGRRPQAVGRIVVMNCVPLSEHYRWHWVARLWRRRGVGEFVNATTTRWGTRQILRQATPNAKVRNKLTDSVMRYLDRGQKRAILELYRDADPEKLGAFGRALGKLDGPALVIWGEDDPYLPAEFCSGWWREALNASAECLSAAGHWPWLDRPEVVGQVAEFLDGPAPA